MTREDVARDVARIAALAGDAERQHSFEDALHVEVLRAIAAGNLTAEQARELAAEALRTTELGFERWCA